MAPDSSAWQGFCERLGKQLLDDPGPGFLSSYVCRPSDPRPSDGRLWHIRISEQDNSLELKLTFFDGIAQEIRTWSFPTEAPIVNSLENELLPLAIARMLVESSPTGWSYEHHADVLSFDPRNEILLLPSDLFVYELGFDKKQRLWLPRIAAQISKVKDKDKEGEDLGERVEYSFDRSYRPLKKGKSYWVRGLENKERQEKYRKTITDLLQGKSVLSVPGEKAKNGEGNLVDRLLRSSQAGFRYGKSIAKSESIVTQADMVSILAEVGSGPLSGLRWYYDFFPELKRGSGSEEEYFSLKRASVGWAFNFPMPASIQPLFTKMDIQPKIGLLDLRSHFYASTPTGRAGLDFNAKNIFDFALEVGGEKNTAWFRSRLWGAFSTANLGVSNKSAVTVKSIRSGVDLYFDLFEAGSWDVNLLTFVTTEQLEISKDPSSLNPETLELYSVSSNLVFAGLGFTIAW